MNMFIFRRSRIAILITALISVQSIHNMHPLFINCLQPTYIFLIKTTTSRSCLYAVRLRNQLPAASFLQLDPHHSVLLSWFTSSCAHHILTPSNLCLHSHHQSLLHWFISNSKLSCFTNPSMSRLLAVSVMCCSPFSVLCAITKVLYMWVTDDGQRTGAI